MKKSLKERTRTTVKASVLPPLRIEIDREKAKDALGAVLDDIKQMKGETIKFGMKEAQRSIRRQQAQAVFVDASLPRVILGIYWLEICSFSKISHFLERILMEHIDMKNSLDSKLQIHPLCSIRIPFRKRVIFKKPLLHISSPTFIS